jgi:predicted ATPase
MAAYYEQSRKLYITNFNNQNIEVKNLFTNILKGCYEFKAGQDWITTEKNTVPLAYTSSGQQEALPMLVILSYIIISTDKNYITIEEPEAHLFPISQKYIIELLALLYSQNNHDFVLTTHSPYILTAINNAILAHDIITEKGKEAVKDIFNPDFSIKYEDVRAYTIENGKLMSILDDETRLIGASVIDSVSDEFENVFNSLLEL